MQSLEGPTKAMTNSLRHHTVLKWTFVLYLYQIYLIFYCTRCITPLRVTSLQGSWPISASLQTGHTAAVEEMLQGW